MEAVQGAFYLARSVDLHINPVSTFESFTTLDHLVSRGGATLFAGRPLVEAVLDPAHPRVAFLSFSSGTSAQTLSSYA